MSNRIRICLNIYNINNNIYKDCYFFGEVLDPNKFLTKINILAEEAIEFMLLDKFDERTSKLLSFETSGIPMKQDFKLRKIRLPKSKMKDYIKLKKISQYSINGKTKRMIRYILNKEFGEKIDDKVHISECPSDDESVDIYGFDKLISEDQNDNKKKVDIDVPIYTNDGKSITKEELEKQRDEIRELERDKAQVKKQEHENLQRERAPIKEKTLTNEQLLMIMNQSTKLPEAELSIEKPLRNSLESKDPEVESNLKMLLSIGFLKEGNFFIRGDKAILNKPCGFAYGDLLKGRTLKYKGSNGQTVFYGFSRLGQHEIDKELEIIFS